MPFRNMRSAIFLSWDRQHAQFRREKLQLDVAIFGRKAPIERFSWNWKKQAGMRLRRPVQYNVIWIR